MSKVHDLGQGWKALEVKGRGVVVSLEMGVVFVEHAKIDDDGSLVADWPVDAPAVEARPAKPGPSSIAAVNVKAFLEEISRRNLTVNGHYGAVGPLIGRLRDVLKDVEPHSPLEESIGSLLALGDHGRLGAAAAIVEMSPEKRAEFAKLLDSRDVDGMEAFVDGCIGGAA